MAQTLGRLGGRQATARLLEGYRDHDPRVRVACVQALAPWYGSKVGQALGDALEDADDVVRQHARNTLAARKDPRALPLLLALARREEPAAKIKALAMLAQYQEPRAEEIVRLLLRDPDAGVRYAALEALGRYDAPWALELQLAAARDEDEEVRRRAAAPLAASSDARARKAVLALLRDPSATVRVYALHALRDARASWAIEAYAELLRDPACSRDAVQILRELGDERAVVPLSAALTDPHVEDKGSVVQALLWIADARAVPALLQTLRVAENEYLIQQAGIVLALAGQDPTAQPAIRAALENEHPAVRKAALQALTGTWSPEAVEKMARLLDDPEPGVRLIAASRLASLRDFRALKPLLALLQGADQGTRMEAAIALARLGGSRAEEALVALLSAPNEESRMNGLAGLQIMRSPMAITAMLDLLPDAMSDVDLRLLGGVADPRMPEPGQFAYEMSRAVRHRTANELIRRLAAMGPQAVEPVLALMRDPQPQTRAAAAIALKELRDTRALPALGAALRDDDLTVRLLAARALRELADVRGLDPLLAALPDVDPLLRVQIAAALGGIGDPRALPDLVTLLQTGTPDEQYAAARALGQLGDHSAADPLLAVLKTHPDDGVRAQAARALGLLGDQRAVEPLLAALEANDRELTVEAVEALAALNDPRVVPVLRAVQEQSRSVFSYDQALAIAAALSRLQGTEPLPDDPLADYRNARQFEKRSALRRIGARGDTRAVEPLLKMLSPTARDLSEIVKVLGELRDPRAVDPLAQAYALLPKEPVISFYQPEFRAGFLRAFGKLQAREAYERVLAAPNDPQREEAARALGALGDRRAIPPLIDALTRGTLPDRRAAGALESLTGQTFGLDAAKWQAWWQAAR